MFNGHIIRHRIHAYPERQLTVIVGRSNRPGQNARVYDVNGTDANCDIDIISIYTNTDKLHIPTGNVTDSPMHITKKIDTPTKHVDKQLFTDLNAISRTGTPYMTTDTDTIIEGSMMTKQQPVPVILNGQKRRTVYL